jgi:hypothetical protein
MDIGGVFGGGNVFGAVLAATAQFPALELANAAFNLLGQAVGIAIGKAIDQLQQEAGMPKFIADALKDALQQTLGGSQQPTSPGAQQQVNEQYGEQFMSSFIENLAKQIVEDVKQEREQQAEQSGSTSGSKKGWLVALAEAFGKMADKAARQLEQDGKNLNTQDPSAMIEYQAQSQEFSLMMNTFTNAIKTIGEAEANTVRKG